MNATPRQTFAIFCAVKMDVRPLNLSLDEASFLISESKKGEDILPLVLDLAKEKGITLRSKDGKPATPKANWADLYMRARQAGLEAANALTPRPMVVVGEGGQQWTVNDGVCGFAWVNIKPGNSAFAKWLKDNRYANKDSYNGGVTVWVHDFNQSYERKLAYARAFATTLKEAGIRAYSGSRLD